MRIWLFGGLIASCLLASSLQAADETTTWNLAHIEIKGSYPEGAQLPSLFGSLSESLSEVIERLDKAAEDDSIKAVVLRIDSPAIGWGKVNEIRQAIDRVQAQDKQVFAILDSASGVDYLLASSCDRIIMPESGTWMVLGLRAEVTFYKNLLDKLNIKADMLRVGEYKSAAEPYSRTEMSPEFREEMEEILDDLYAKMLTSIAKNRNLTPEQVEAAIDSAPHGATTAKELGLIDHIGYADQVDDIIKGEEKNVTLSYSMKYGKKKVDTDFSGLTGMVKMMNMLMGVEPQKRKTNTPKIAVIHATGMIMTGKSSTSLLGETVLGSETLIKAIRQANEDDTVKAIVLRVDSPGGSALASDLIWRELELVKKPLIVSMGEVAASGGYYISMGADYIFAEPGTLTGSIGVVGGKIALNGLFEKVGVTTTVISRGKNSGINSILHGFSEEERKAMQKMMNEIYDQFVAKAAQGRKMDVEALEKLARGRVYTGSMALELKLVDELGTLDDAVAKAMELAGMKPDDDVERLILPRPSSPFEALFGDLDVSLQSHPTLSPEVIRLMQMMTPEMRAQMQGIEIIDLLSKEPILTVLPYSVRIK